MSEDVIITAGGSTYRYVSTRLSEAEMLDYVNQHHPSGRDRSWRLASGMFAATNGVSDPKRPGYKKYVLLEDGPA